MAHVLMHKAERAVETFIDEVTGDDRDSVTFAEVEAIASEVGIHVSTIVALVKGYGVAIGTREVPREVRGFTSNSHDRWHGKGSCKTHGGSGWEQISGFAGQKG
jgi:hypothetical protein